MSTPDVPEVGPLGPGHDPAKDPMKGIRGVMAGTLVLEAITIWLALTVILRVDDGAYWTTFNWVAITALGAAHLIMAFFQRMPWALPVNLALQVLLLAGVFIHPSVGIIAIIFIIVWWYLMHLRSTLIERMKRGLLTTQHL
ncbi:DUF4233 domain-containing protein [Corynebacterium testudinoris]|uniref:Putative DUF4233 family protein n=1 Tax=Corynebacterium testudinoris TaxID=136857 RepID=A0A0G3HE35_9CORY|nr:DUF4233 domain-containing protein [Corynebacterium testudinoris]AKK09412.1 putative DUF4233 family protein [Corynebacterium testudinoris]MBX8995219.1 DUF4233 domain-containing protein [Corynebacterium testudinoris]